MSTYKKLDDAERMTRVETILEGVEKNLDEIKKSIRDLLNPISSLDKRQDTLDRMITEDRLLRARDLKDFVDFDKRLTKLENERREVTGVMKVLNFIWKWLAPVLISAVGALITIIIRDNQ